MRQRLEVLKILVQLSALVLFAVAVYAGFIGLVFHYNLP